MSIVLDTVKWLVGIRKKCHDEFPTLPFFSLSKISSSFARMEKRIPNTSLVRIGADGFITETLLETKALFGRNGETTSQEARNMYTIEYNQTGLLLQLTLVMHPSSG